MERIAYGGWRNAIRLTDGESEWVVTTEVGPRILHFGAVGGPNLLKEYPEQMGQTGGTEWRIYGGHRLWHAPEAKPRTYSPDNDPVSFEEDGRTLRLVQNVEPETRIRKEMEITVVPHGGGARILHRLVNDGPWPIVTAVWALTVMAPGGRAILPQEPFRSHAEHLLPARPLVLWHYTDMSDPRWSWGRRFIQLRQDPGLTAPQKIGLLNRRGWAAYTLGGDTLVKRYPCDAKAAYPDFGCNTEIFTNDEMLEVESLGPLRELAPGGGSVEHVEHWLRLPFGLGTDEDEIAGRLASCLSDPGPAGGDPA